MAWLDGAGRGGKEGLQDDVAELSHVARPRMTAEGVDGAGQQRRGGSWCVDVQELPGEGLEVVGPLPDRRDPQGGDGNPVVEVLAEPPCCDLVDEVLVGRRDQTEVGGHGATRPHRGDLPGLQHPEEGRLELRGEVPDLVEEQGAAPRFDEGPGPPFERAGEGSALMAKKCGVGRTRVERPAVERDPRPLAARTRDVKAPGHAFFSSPGLAMDEDRDSERPESPHLPKELTHRPAARDEREEPLFGVERHGRRFRRQDGALFGRPPGVEAEDPGPELQAVARMKVGLPSMQRPAVESAAGGAAVFDLDAAAFEPEDEVLPRQAACGIGQGQVALLGPAHDERPLTERHAQDLGSVAEHVENRRATEEGGHGCRASFSIERAARGRRVRFFRGYDSPMAPRPRSSFVAALLFGACTPVLDPSGSPQIDDDTSVDDDSASENTPEETPPEPTPPPGCELPPGPGVTGEIPCLGDASALDGWSFEVQPGQAITVRVDTVSAETTFDAAARLVDGEALSVAAGDDQCACTFPPPAFSCPQFAAVAAAAGLMRVEVYSFGGGCAGTVGGYRLWIQSDGIDVPATLVVDDGVGTP